MRCECSPAPLLRRAVHPDELYFRLHDGYTTVVPYLTRSLRVLLRVGRFFVVIVVATTQHLGEEGELALSSPRPGRHHRHHHHHHRRHLHPQQQQHQTAATPTHEGPNRAPEQSLEHGDSQDQPTSAAAARTGPGELTLSGECAGADGGTVASTASPREAPAGAAPRTTAGLSTKAARTGPLTRIDLSRHQISDDGAAALGLALRGNVRVEVRSW